LAAFSAGGDGSRNRLYIRLNPHTSFAASDCRTIAIYLELLNELGLYRAIKIVRG
jgi:hypothetical protein